jgi:hypothetical protein
MRLSVWAPEAFGNVEHNIGTRFMETKREILFRLEANNLADLCKGSLDARDGCGFVPLGIRVVERAGWVRRVASVPSGGFPTWFFVEGQANPESLSTAAFAKIVRCRQAGLRHVGIDYTPVVLPETARKRCALNYCRFLSFASHSIAP